MGMFRRLAGLLGFSKDEGHEVRDENVGPHNNLPRKGFSVPVQVPVSRDLPGPILVQCNRGAGGVQVINGTNGGNLLRTCNSVLIISAYSLSGQNDL